MPIGGNKTGYESLVRTDANILAGVTLLNTIMQWLLTVDMEQWSEERKKSLYNN